MNEFYAPPRLIAPIDASPRLPGSKSMAQRALVAAALCDKATLVVGAGTCDDVLAMERGLGSLGYALERHGEDLLVQPRPTGAEPDSAHPRRVDVGESGTALRLLTSLAALTPGRFELTGRPGLLRRPIGELSRALVELGASLTDRAGLPPVVVEGRELPGGAIRIDASRSSQFVSSLLLVAPRFASGLTVETTGVLASPGYLELTRRVLEAFGVSIEMEGRPDGGVRVQVPAAALRSSGCFEVEADWSAAGAFTLLAELSGGRSAPRGLRDDSLQPDRGFGDVLANLRGTGPRTVDVARLPDQTMNLAIAAALRSGTTEVTGAANLRLKESDRLAVTARELRRLGGRVEVLPDGLRIEGGAKLHGGRIDPEGDHRMAMAFAVLGAFVEGVEVGQPECVAKSFPGFFEELDAALATRRCIALIGQRGSGKSTLGRRLAEELRAQFVDLDERFEEEHGPITAFVENRGWPAFREQEARLLRDSLAPGRVVATGGGVIETPAALDALESEAFVVHLDATLAALRQRLAAEPDRRPSVTGRNPLEELADLEERRRPTYLACADVTLASDLPPDELLNAALAVLRQPWVQRA